MTRVMPLTSGSALALTLLLVSQFLGCAQNMRSLQAPTVVYSPTGAIPPDSPTVQIVTAGDGQVTVTFDPPSYSGSAPITTYTVVAWPDGATASGTSSPITVSGLDNGTYYTFTVTASNAAGSSSPSSASPPAMPTGAPGAPSVWTLDAQDSQVDVGYTPPASNGGVPITSYTVTSDPGGFTGTGHSSPITVTGLTNGTTYTFTITATNAKGTSPPSAPSIGVTPGKTSDAPTIGTATAGNHQATVSFTPPVSNGGSEITQYTVKSSPGNISETGTTSPITVTQLTNGIEYTFTVTATNAVGMSNPSSASNAVTPNQVPDAPTIGTAIPGNMQAIVSFTQPEAGNPILLYTVTSSPEGITATGTASPITVSGLTNGTAYQFTVTATNSVATSSASSPSGSVTPAVLPSAPSIDRTFAGNRQITVYFSPPNSNGGASITRYTVTSNPDGIQAIGGTSPITVTGLSNGTSYTFTITATNNIGTGPSSAVSASATPVAMVGGSVQGSALNSSNIFNIPYVSLQSFDTDGTYLYSANGANILKTLLATGELSVLAGSPFNVAATPADHTDPFQAKMSDSMAISVGDGHVLFSDSSGKCIRSVDLTSGAVVTIAGSCSVIGGTDGDGNVARFKSVTAMTYYGGVFFAVDNTGCTLRKLVSSDHWGTAAGVTVSTVAGIFNLPGVTNTVDNGLAAKFSYPSGITNDGHALYVTEIGSHLIRRLVPDNGVGLANLTNANVTVSTIAGSTQGDTTGLGTVAQFFQPNAITTDGSNLYVNDTRNYCIRKISPQGGNHLYDMTQLQAGVSTLIGHNGNGDTNGYGTNGVQVGISLPGMTVIGTNLVFSDAYSNSYKTVNLTNAGVSDFYVFPIYVSNVATNGTYVYVTDLLGMRILKWNVAGHYFTPVAGRVNLGFADGLGELAKFQTPVSITTDGINLFVLDSSNYALRMISPLSGTIDDLDYTTATVSTIAGNGTQGYIDGTSVTQTRLYNPLHITTDDSALYLTEGPLLTSIRRVSSGSGALALITSANAIVETIAGRTLVDTLDGPGNNARLQDPTAITTDGTYLYFLDNAHIRRAGASAGTLATANSQNIQIQSIFANNSNQPVQWGTYTGSQTLYSTPHATTSISTDGTNLFAGSACFGDLFLIPKNASSVTEDSEAASIYGIINDSSHIFRFIGNGCN